MPTIGNNLLPYPNTSDEPNVPKAISDLASAVDMAIGGGGRIYQTLAALQAVPSSQLFTGMRAFVVADTAAANNVEYVYTSGTWTPVLASPILVSTLKWTDTNASGNPYLQMDVLYDPPTGFVTLVGYVNGNLSGLSASTSYDLFKLPTTLVPPSLLSAPQIYLSTADTESIFITRASGQITMSTASGTTISTGRFPRFTVTYPAAGGRNRTSF